MLQDLKLYCESDEVDLTSHLLLSAPIFATQVKPPFEREASATVALQLWLRSS